MDSNANSTKALSLRAQALALLQQAEALDGLKPYLVHHLLRDGSAAYLLWSAEGVPDTQDAELVLDHEYEPDNHEDLVVSDDLSLEELTGVALTARLADILDSQSADEGEVNASSDSPRGG